MKELLYALPSGGVRPAPEWGLTLAHMTYRIIPGPRLAGVGLTAEVRGGAMFIVCPGDGLDGDPRFCCRQVAGECRRREFDRVICDFEGAPSPALSRLVTALSETCTQNKLTLYLPEAFASLAPGCRVLVSSALVTGTLARRLERAADSCGKERVVLAVEAMAEDFLLPASGRGTPLTWAELAALMRRLEPAVFFDRGLCAHYFTYMAAGGKAHFVLFDTPRSVQEKLTAAQNLGISSALLAAPQVEDWLEDIFGSDG